MQFTTPQGIQDKLSNDILEQIELNNFVLNICREWGYEIVSPSIIDKLSNIKQTRPELVQNAFKFTDIDGTLLTIRPDLTIPIGRIATTRLRNQPRPLRLCYGNSIFQLNSKKYALSREYPQVGIELIGNNINQQQSNIECLSLLLYILNQLKITKYKIIFNDLSIIKEYSEEKIHDLKTGNLLPYSDEQLISEINQNSTGNLQNISKLQDLYNDKFIVNKGLIPDINFYTGLYFSVIHTDTCKPIASGGRYDNLIGHYGEPEHAIGFSINVNALLEYSQQSFEIPELGQSLDNTDNNLDNLLDQIKRKIQQ